MNKLETLYHTFLQHREITTDSRNVPAGSIFFALKGEHFDGNKYALQAIDKGAVLAIVDDDDLPVHDALFHVEDVLSTLQDLAHYHREKLSAKVIGITGSNGKTTTKELLDAVLGSSFTTMATKGNLNNHIGVPLTLLSFLDDLKFGIVEMGANHIGEIEALSEIANPDCGIITNIGRAHLEGFGSFEGVIQAKTELYKHLEKNGGTVFVNAKNSLLTNASEGIDRILYGSTHTAVYGKIIRQDPFLEMECNMGESSMEISTKLVGAYNLENILAAVAIGLFFEVKPDAIRSAIEGYTPANNRSQVVKTKKNTLILDAYNANPSSMEAALMNFASADYPNKMLILGEMAELGSESESEHAKLLELIEKLGFQDVILIGDKFRIPGFEKFTLLQAPNEMAKVLQENKIENNSILIKGSRSNRLEQLVDLL